MVVRREKKSRYMRGSRTHGWGRVGQHRRRGRKAGRGKVGYHKHKWTWTVKYAPDWYGSKGFTRHPSITPQRKMINVGVLDEMAEELLEKGIAVKEGDMINIDVTKLGYNKLGGEGKVTRPLLIYTLEATERALSKVKEAGGKVVIPGEG